MWSIYTMGCYSTIKRNEVWGTWMAQVVKRPISAQVMMSQFVSSSPASGSVLTACSEPEGCSRFCLPFSLPLPRSHSVSVRLKNK